MSIEHIYMRPSRLKRYIEEPCRQARTGNRLSKTSAVIGEDALADLEVDARAPLQVVAEQ